MAAATSSRQRREDGSSWEHRRTGSQDQRQNFSLPKSYGAQSPDSPLSPDEFLTPNSSHFPPPQSGVAAIGDDYDNEGWAEYQPVPSKNMRDHNRRPSDYEDRNAGQTYDMAASRPKQARHADALGYRTQNAASNATRSKPSYGDRERDNSSNWVHREKLIALEIQDHIDRGQNVPKALLDAHAASGVEGYSADRRHPQNDLTENNLQRHTFTSPEPSEEQEAGYYEEDDEEYIPEDPRTPEEIAADREAEHAQSMYHSPRLRSSSSRIPVSKASPHPVPQEHLERNAPLPRKRSASIGLDGDGLVYPRTRSRSQSVGSQVLLDDVEPVPGVPLSPGKARQWSKSTPRKASANERTTSFSKRNASNGTGTSPSVRPPTRDRPRTAANRPEEPAPWLADMYKPDPHLPQDQQIIPTHAKRIMQEQMEREQRLHGETETEKARMQDARRAPDEQQARRAQEEYQARRAPEERHAPRAPEDYGAQPAPDVSEKRPVYESPAPSIRNEDHYPEPMRSPGSEHGGYSTMPRVQEMSPITSQSMRMQQAIHIQDPGDGVPEKKGCGCCVVM